MNPMHTMAVDCSWADTQLEGDISLLSLLPVELLSLIRNSSGSQYLEAIASAALQSVCTDKLSAYYRDLLPEISARWLSKIEVSSFADHVSVLSSLAKVLPFAPYLKPYVKTLLSKSSGFSNFGNAYAQLADLDEEELYIILLAFFRLFTYDVEAFKLSIHPALFPSLFKHRSLPVRYIAVQCFSQVMGLADAFSSKLVTKHVGDKAISGIWEGREIDFRLLRLLEEQRWNQQKALLATLAEQSSTILSTQARTVGAHDLCPDTANIGGVLLPRFNLAPLVRSSLIHTSTTTKSLREVGIALLGTKSILLSGEPGSGKTSLVLEAAREMNKSSSLITLHLNEQTDAKSLLGLYTTSEETGSFTWQPGVLTQAMREGRWILIEDIDKAPPEVLGVIQPILQDGKLYLPNRKEVLRAADGFRIFATVRTNGSSSNGSSYRNSWFLNRNHWSIIKVTTPDHSEICEILKMKFPSLHQLIPSIVAVHYCVEAEYQNNHALRSTTARVPSLRDLLKWCRRTVDRLQLLEATSGTSISEAIKLDIFKDAVDSYAGHLARKESWSFVVDSIAKKMQIAPQQAQHCLADDLPNISLSTSAIQIGRVTLPKLPTSTGKQKRLTPFAFTREASMTLGKIAAATNQSEPVLLVGETGVGKTTLVQHLADLLGQSLTVVNLSQQSEASDLLGGLKPITTRSLMMPMVDQFSILFDDTFSAKKNDKFLSSLQRFVSRENWQRVLSLWQQAVQMATNSLAVPPAESMANGDVRTAKRRKLDTPKYQGLRDRWTAFSESLDGLRVSSERAERRLVFSYVEGKIVQAVRQGGWLLLDEINLASSDTLDNIASLLTDIDQERPYLHLAEAGSVERVVAHSDFRLFGAMNPATDTGKKDLAPGIRSRFTEIWVGAGDTDIHGLITIIETYLGSLLDSDKRLAFDLANLYLAVKALNLEHRIVDGAGDDPHFTIRSLVRCLLYVQKHAAAYGLRRAVMEGANMSFCTMLNRESELMIIPIIDRHILSEVKNARGYLSQKPRLPSDGVEYVSFKHHLVMKGHQNITTQPHYIRTPSVERNLLNLARATSMHRFPILLQGPTSSGKTSMVEYLAKSTGNEFVRINNHEHTDLQEYLGGYASGEDGRLDFREGVLVQALRQGHWIVLDELNLAPSDVLEALNRLLDDNRELLIPETQEIVKPHPGFMLFATQNPAGLYGGRKRLSRAFRNRFLELHFDDIPEDELEVILQRRSKIAPSYCTQIVAVYKRLSLQRQSTRLFEQNNSFATLRDLFRWASRPMDDRTELATQGFMLLGERVRDSAERQIVKSIIEEVIRVQIDLNALYDMEKVPPLVSEGPVIWTPAMRRLFVLVSTALKNNEPVLLVGETGCGKTQVCQTVAQAFQHDLNIYNAHTNTETGDLIGSQRPLRHKSQVDDEFKGQILDLLRALDSNGEFGDATIDDLLQKLQSLDLSNIGQATLADIRAKSAKRKSLFEWVDGSLVRAMKSGQFFLLDEISLAEDSVLERLNSLLEPSRTILLAEKGSTNNLVVAANGFQFLATMNPGGDYGKRELSAALRNRLTEIWVPQLSEAEDVLPILESKLSIGLHNCAKFMLEFSIWFRVTFFSAITEAVPLRDLITWANFLNQNPQLDANTALYHGAAMVFVDCLGANPAGITSSTMANLNEARMLCLQKLSEITKTPPPAIYHEDLFLKMTKNSFRIGQYEVRREAAASERLQLVFEAPTTLKNTMRLMRALQMRRPVLLEGNPGVGKTAIVTALAHAVGKRLTRINLSEQTDLMDLFGADVPMENQDIGTFAWKNGPFLQAMQSGEWVLLDEMNLASQSVLEGLNSCLDHRQEVYVAELDQSFCCHPDFKLFAAQNPHHQGGGRKGLPKSYVSRFTVVYADPFEKGDLYQISSSKFSEIEPAQAQAVVDITCEVQRLTEISTCFSAGGPWEFNLRDVSRWLQVLEQTPSLFANHYSDCFISQRMRNPQQRELARAVCSATLGTDHQPSLYHSLTPEVFQVGTAFLSRDISWQRSRCSGQTISTKMLSYARSAIHAINHKWPVIMVDSTGKSSSVLIRQLAALAGASITNISMNADTDTMDLIGGFEQFDPYQDMIKIKRRLQKVVEKEVLIALQKDDSVIFALLELQAICSNRDSSLPELQTHIKKLSNVSANFQEILFQVEYLLSKQQTTPVGFAWNDGVLVQALQEGRWLILENANACNPAVLDRLNSLLEPDGVLIVSEQHNSMEGTRKIQTHPNFRIFLTLDPRHGELSRAMRNRSLELCIDETFMEQTERQPLGYLCAASLYRIRHIERMEIEKAALVRQPLLMSIGVDHILRSELSILESLSTGNCFSVTLQAILRDQLKARKWISPRFKRQGHGVQAELAIQQYPSEVQARPDLSSPFLNEPLTSLSSIWPVRQRAERYTWAFQLLLEIYAVFRMVDQANERSSKITFKDQNLLERSIGRGKGTAGQTIPFADFIVMTATAIQDVIEGSHELPYNIENNDMRYVENVLAFIKDILALSSASILHPGVLLAYLQNGYDLVKKTTQPATLATALSAALDCFTPALQLSSGQSLSIMWEVFRPLTATTDSQLEVIVQIEDFSERLGCLPCAATSLSYIIKAKSQLAQVYRDVLTGGTSDAKSFHEFDGKINELEAIAVDEPANLGHFSGAFKSILQLKDTSETHSADQILVSLAKSQISLEEVTLEDQLVPQAFTTLLRISGSSSPDRDWDAWRDKFGLELIQKIGTSEEQPLYTRDWMRIEISQLLQALTSSASLDSQDVLRALRQELRSIVLDTISCHKELLSTDDGLRALHDGADVKLDFLPEITPDHYFRKIYETYFANSFVWLQESRTPISLTNIAASFIAVSLGLLQIFVPDQAYDPALNYQVAHNRFKRRKHDLQSFISAQKLFESKFTGQESNLMIRIMEAEMQDLGQEPPVAAVVRPSGNELQLLAVEFSNLLRAIVDSQPEKFLLARAAGKWGNDKVTTDEIRSQAKKLLQVIEQIVNRLRLMHRAFDDLTRPVLWILQSLALGTRMLVAGEGGETQASQFTKAFANRIPFVSFKPAEVMNLPLPPVKSLPGKPAYCFNWLEHFMLLQSIESASPQRKAERIGKLLQLTDSMYDSWKAKLKEDQAEAVVKSKYYTYRGDEDMTEFQETQAVADMFPTFDEKDPNKLNTSVPSTNETETTAVALAKIQQLLFSSTNRAVDLEPFIDRSLAQLTNHATQQDLEIGPVSSKALLPMILLKLDRKLSELDATERQQKIDIYTDGDTVEAQKLQGIVKDVVSKFRMIHQAWPEHAVPAQVLDLCRETMTLSLKDPVAKLLTKTEKLLDTVGQWQVVASREFAVNDQMDALTKLIIQWRQLELSSWSRLLDLEEQKIANNALSWYFMLYEAIIYNTRQVSLKEDSLLSYLDELARTLDEFLSSTSCGEFSYRLQLSQSFERFLANVAAEDCTLQLALNCVKNVLRHHERYRHESESKLASGRLELERKLREQIQLASWKDTNVSALRESARRSHFKLFKIVRKYRTLLSQPLQQKQATLQMRGLSTMTAKKDPVLSNVPTHSVNEALMIASQIISGWETRPERLRNPIGAAVRMRLLVNREDSDFEASAELSRYITSFQSTVKDLRNRTPTVMTEETQSQINYLKGLKQSLFSETLRKLKQMGVKRDLGTIELEGHASRATILARIPNLAIESYRELCQMAENDFHEVLDVLPDVRNALTTQSEQVRVADVRRSVAYADGLLSILIQQRRAIGRSEHSTTNYSQVLHRLSTFARHTIDGFSRPPHNFMCTKEALIRRLYWLPELLTLSTRVIQVQAKYSGACPEDLLTRLADYKNSIHGQLKKLHELPHLPQYISSPEEGRILRAVKEDLIQMKKELGTDMIKYPNYATVLQQLISWADTTTINIEPSINGFSNVGIDEFDVEMRECLDIAFEAVQRVNVLTSKLPESAETHGWLLSTNKRQAEMIDGLQISAMSDKISSLEARLGHVADEHFHTGIFLIVTALPVLEQYFLTCRHVIGQALLLHSETAKMTVVLAKTLTVIATEGFCNPQDAPKGEEQSGPVESGTGLGDGTGADDISKDVADDEDLSELAQTENEKSEGQELEASKDAVNMDKEEMKGDDGAADDSAGEDDTSNQSGEEEGSDLDEEAGSVDNLDPSAVDEKMWEGLDAENDKALGSEKAKGEKSDEATAKSEKTATKDEAQQDPGSDGDANDSSSESEDEVDGVGGDEADQADPNLQEERPLDLPEEMQLNGDEEDVRDDVSDGGMAELSDVEVDAGPTESQDVESEGADEKEKDQVEEGLEDDLQAETGSDDGDDQGGAADEDEILQAQPEPDDADRNDDHDLRNDDMNYDLDEAQAGQLGQGGAIDAEDDTAKEKQEASAAKSDQTQEQSQVDSTDRENEKGTDATGGTTRGGRSEAQLPTTQAEALEKLGNMLEEWHRRREIFQPSQAQTEPPDDIDMVDADFEHIQHKDDKTDSQALGAASNEQAQALDQSKAVEDQQTQADTEHAPADVDDPPTQENMVERFSQLQTGSEMQQDPGRGAVMPEQRQILEQANGESQRIPMEDEDLGEDEEVNSLLVNGSTTSMSSSEALQLWSHYSAKVQHISLILTEQLRLILAPTLATKLRGDFRTGKRLNIKRIIPYIASGYKRDKIWMRRSVPSKRNYQIMLALDDSKSMMEGGAGALALETLAMLCKSLSMLEVGDICVVGFGNEEHIRVAHPFGQPFGNEAGVKIFQNFTFNQNATDVKKMAKESIALFQDARANSIGTQSELWQLQLIISDGICEDHETISRLVRQAKEQKIMIVFVMVDGSGESILDLKQASFEADETGEMKLSMRRYLDRFPFPYYLVVRDVRDLPAVLATALKGWFAQVVDIQG